MDLYIFTQNSTTKSNFTNSDSHLFGNSPPPEEQARKPAPHVGQAFQPAQICPRNNEREKKLKAPSGGRPTEMMIQRICNPSVYSDPKMAVDLACVYLKDELLCMGLSEAIVIQPIGIAD